MLRGHTAGFRGSKLIRGLGAAGNRALHGVRPRPLGHPPASHQRQRGSSRSPAIKGLCCHRLARAGHLCTKHFHEHSVHSSKAQSKAMRPLGRWRNPSCPAQADHVNSRSCAQGSRSTSRAGSPL